MSERDQQPPADVPQYGLGSARSLVIVAVALLGLVAGVGSVTLLLTSQLGGSRHSAQQKPNALVPSAVQPPSSDVGSIPSAEDSFPSAPDSSPTPEDASAVVKEFYQDINNNEFTAAWELGGKNIAGTSYAKWVAGFDTTENVGVETAETGDPEQVGVVIRATQSDGSVKVFEGTYTVSGGEIVTADIG